MDAAGATWPIGGFMYSFESEWVFESNLEPLWQALADVENWPKWWPNLKHVEPTKPGDVYGVGVRYRQVWKLEQHLVTLEAQITEVIEPHLLEIQTTGFLDSYNQWAIREAGIYSLVHHTWMGNLEGYPAWNQRQIMLEAARNLSQGLGIKLVEIGTWAQAAQPPVWLQSSESKA